MGDILMGCTGGIDNSCIDWQMMEMERNLVHQGCRLDGMPGLSKKELEVLESNDKDAQALLKHYRTRFSFLPNANLHRFFYATVTNAANGVTSIIKNGNGSKFNLNELDLFENQNGIFRDIGLPNGGEIHHFGGAFFRAKNKLGLKEQEKLIEYVVQELNKKGVNFRKEDVDLRIKFVGDWADWTNQRDAFEYYLTFRSPFCDAGGPEILQPLMDIPTILSSLFTYFYPLAI